MSAPAGTSTDPFSIVEEAIWFGLESYPPLRELVKVGNRIKLVGNKANPWETTSQAGDFPELQLWQGGASTRPGDVPRSSDGYFWRQRYSIGVSTSYIRTNLPAAINNLRFCLMRAMFAAETMLVAPAIPFVNSVFPGDYRDQMNDVNPDGHERKASGWKSVLDIDVLFFWSKREMLA